MDMILEDGKICRDLRRAGEWEPEVADAIELYANKDWTFVDLGAHVGFFTLMASRLFKNVIAAEPQPKAWTTLIHNLTLNEVTNVEVHNAAVWDTNEGAEMYLVEPNTGMSWITRKSKEGAMAVPTMTLPEILGERRPEFWKIDIEGSEYTALKECPEVLENAHVIVTEYCTSQLERTSNATGRMYYDVLGDFCWHTLKGKPVNFDVLPTGGYDNFLLFRR